MLDILIKNGIIFDGTGQGRGLRTDIGIEGQTIVKIQDMPNETAREVIDAENLYVAPGFIDVQNHSDSHGQILTKPALESLVTQGVTTILIGHCGASLAPLPRPESIKSLQKWGLIEGVNVNWQTFDEFARAMKDKRFGADVATLVGHATLRRVFTGDQTRALSLNEIEQMCVLLDKSLTDGALGLSVGFQYAHELNTSPDEIKMLLNVLKKHNKLLSVHLRSQDAGVVEATDEILELVRQSQVKTKIAHFKLEGRAQSDNLYRAIDIIEKTYQTGTQVNFDVYPYTTSWHPIYVYLPSWVYAGGFKPMLKRLKDKKMIPKIVHELSEKRLHLANLLISSSPKVSSFVGKTINDIARTHNVTVEEAFVRVITGNYGQAVVFDSDIDPSQITVLLKHPLSMVATDGVGYPLDEILEYELPHPRCFGTFPRFLRLLRDKSEANPAGPLMTWAQGLAKITSLPANLIGLTDRGVIKAGKRADIVIFDPNTVSDLATYANPYRANSGIKYVITGGKISLFAEQLTGVKQGRLITS